MTARIVLTLLTGLINSLLILYLATYGRNRRMGMVAHRVLVTVYAVSKSLSTICIASGHPRLSMVTFVGDAALVFSIYYDDNRWKKLWRKLKSQGLTAVNAARFQQ